MQPSTIAINFTAMTALIETSFDTPDGIADCRLELMETDNGHHYSVTILYPNTVNGFSRSEIYCHDLLPQTGGGYQFDPMDENIHPKIKKLQAQLSAIIV